ncbi:MAG TPA: UDP-galactopyranose mutase [Opitutaceae bacterium]|nr:UDP-galactopyranose mutase [Opitutaceae bacterium]HWB98894.1 UDP-galactopyranose mutase [Bryobacteraceae bacterium]
MEISGLKYLVVGAGFYGAVMAERIAAVLGEKVLVIDRRDHIGGNSWSEIDPESGVEIHKYGSHIFHTSNQAVWDYINRFTAFNRYRHRVLTTYRDKVYTMPINLMTVNSYYGINLRPSEVGPFLDKEIRSLNLPPNPANLEEKAMSLIGRPLYEAFIRGYTIKQWDRDPRELPASIITRLPVRNLYNDAYFDDPYQGIPLDGYAAIFKRMLDHPLIDVRLGVDFFELRDRIPPGTRIIYTGPLDRFFDFRYGVLGWRTLRFEKEVKDTPDYQGTTVMNYADEDVPYTRIHEFKHFHPERKYVEKNPKTVLYREYSLLAGRELPPFYPISSVEDRAMLELYQQERAKHPQVLFGGRLGSYKYFDMDMAIAAALKAFEDRIKPPQPARPA